jgi:8-oxo-dGTP diphosphatase
VGDHRPLVGVGAVVIRDGAVLLIRRGKDPLKGRWTLPGGTVEWGEPMRDALVREIEEETGLTVRPGEILAVFERIEGKGERSSHHHVIVDFLCESVSGSVRAGSDAEAAVFVPRDELDRYGVPAKTAEVVGEAYRRLRG